jgi:2'-5' RNA ligase
VPGRSALVLLVPEAEPLVGRLRLAHDPACALGVPAHVTLLFPFAPAARIDGELMGGLARELAACAPLDLRFDRVARFPDVAYLALVDPAPVVALVRALAAAWPEYPPYEGRFPDVVPHLTVAHGDRAVLDRVAAEVTSGLPRVARVEEASLLVEDESGRWSVRAAFRLGPA